jgi:uronate dehydrogenase
MAQTHTDLSNQTWIMTGASGLVGTCLRRAIAPLVSKLHLIDLTPITNLSPTETSSTTDISDLQALQSIFTGADGIIHLAGISDEADFHDLMHVNVVGTYNIFEAARRSGVKRVLFASSNRVTGFYPTDTLVHPDMPCRPDGFYGASKVAGEAIARLYADKFDLEVVALRIGSFEERPLDRRNLSTWLSPGDCVRAFLAGMRVDKVHFETVYAVSRNTRVWWDVEPGRKIGFEPADDAEVYAKELSTGSDDDGREAVQGGMFATKEFTLVRQRN